MRPIARHRQGEGNLELALREPAPLATFDEPLRATAKREGVVLFDDV
jgi:hypothetical protein